MFYLKDYLSGNSDDVTKDEFITFIKKTSDRSSSEFRQLYYFLLNCFKEGDVKRVIISNVYINKLSSPVFFNPVSGEPRGYLKMLNCTITRTI